MSNHDDGNKRSRDLDEHFGSLSRIDFRKIPLITSEDIGSNVFGPKLSYKLHEALIGKIRIAQDSAISESDKLEFLRTYGAPRNLYLTDFEANQTTKPAAADPIEFPQAMWLECITPHSSDFLANLEEVYVNRYLPRYGPRRATMVWQSQCAIYALTYWGGVMLNAFAKLVPKFF